MFRVFKLLLFNLVMIAVSLFFYARWTGSIEFALGIFAMLALHESGHLLMLGRFGISASPPLFTPFGAIINLDEPVTNLWQEVQIALMGPIFGAIFCMIAVFLNLFTGRQIWADLAVVMAIVNLINMLPVGSLDGGRVIHAILYSIWEPLIYLHALVSLVAFILLGYHLSWMFYLLAVFFLLEIRAVAKSGAEFNTMHPGRIGISLLYYLLTGASLAAIVYFGAWISIRL